MDEYKLFTYGLHQHIQYIHQIHAKFINWSYNIMTFEMAYTYRIISNLTSATHLILVN